MKITRSELRRLYDNTDVVKVVDNVPASYKKIAHLEGMYGCNGEVFSNDGVLYVIDYRLPKWVVSKG